MKQVISISVILLLAACGNTTGGRSGAEAVRSGESSGRPNVLVILADDMGYSDLGAYGGEIDTPHLDALAAGSRRYRRFYNAARCCPTRAALLTGRYPHAVGMGGMVSPREATPDAGPYQGYLRHDLPTLAETLQGAGYRTWMSGKWHVGEHPDNWPLRRGFERYFGLISGASSYYTIRTDQPRYRQMVLDSLPWSPPATGFYATSAYGDFAVERLGETDEQPFFGYLAFTAPHWPLHAPEATVRKYLPRYAAGWDSLRIARHARQLRTGLVPPATTLLPTDPEVPPWTEVTDRATWVRKMAVYAAMVEEMDQAIGRVLSALESTGQRNNTLVFFLSDNGGCDESVVQRNLHRPGSTIGRPGSYEAYERPWSQLSNVPFRRYKAWVNEGGIATPLLLAWPAGGVAPEWTDATGHVVDISATVLAAAGIISEGPGRPLTAPEDPERLLFWEHQGQQAVRRGRYKLLRNSPDQPWRLYDLFADPTESTDLVGKYPDTVAELTVAYNNWWNDVNHW